MAKKKADGAMDAAKSEQEKVKKKEKEVNKEECEGADAKAEKETGAKAKGKAKAEKAESAKPEAAAEAEEPQEEGDAKYIRLMADFQNYKRRTEKEKSDIYAYANEGIALQLLEVMDNFDRALSQAEGGAGFEEGMKLIFKQLQEVLEKNGIKEIETLGADFDPNFHNAVMAEDTDEFESGKVSAVLQKGYTLNGKVIRPSMVKVAN